MRKLIKQFFCRRIFEQTFKWVLLAITLLVPEFALADPMNFTPPPSDVSVTFLTNIFGVVDGVLYGGGSQILGTMFATFNAAVLALGGMVLTYTTLVATINTAGEGKLLGKTWSSIWIPIRTTFGIALLFTYSSGYSVIQVFVMWLVVQGVGAGDLIWEAALGYLQRGGVIIQPTMTTKESLSADYYNIIEGASVITTGTACMVGLEEQLNTIRTKYLADKENEKGACYNLGKGTTDTYMAKLCDNPVPDFLGSIDIMQAQQDALDVCVPIQNTCGGDSADDAACCKDNTCCATPVTVYMPNFDSSDPYADLNGVCGKIVWNLIDPKTVSSTSDDLDLTESESDDMMNARAISVNQMYSELSVVGNAMAANDLTLTGTENTVCDTSNGGSCYVYDIGDYSAAQPFGVPTPSSGYIKTTPQTVAPCDRASTCNDWESPDNNFSALTDGVEFQGAVGDYNSLMQPTLNALYNTADLESATAFVEDAEDDGWILAGSYYYDLVNLNESSQNSSTDKDSGLNLSLYPQFDETDGFCGTSTNDILCTWYGGSSTKYNQQIAYLIRGPVNDGTDQATKPAFSNSSWPSFYTQELNATAYGYVSNASNLTIEGQNGLLAPDSFQLNWTTPDPVTKDFDTETCSSSMLWGMKALCNVIVNKVIIGFLNLFIEMAMMIFQLFIQILIGVPLSIFSQMFVEAASYMDYSVNSIISLAKMGNLFIETSVTVWFLVAVTTGALAVFPVAAPAILVVLIISGPFVISWFAVLFAMGISLTYYLPMLPFIIFTFASFGWMIGVLEAMVAAPLVALGVSLPEGGHDVFGKGAESMMLLLGAFLRPAMIIIGFISAMILSTVGVWLINTGFEHFETTMISTLQSKTAMGMWTTMFSNFFLFGTYVVMCTEVVTKSFDMTFKLGDGILRWIGGNMTDAFGAGVVGDIGQKVSAQVDKGGKAVEAGAMAQRDFSSGAKADGGGGTKGASGSSLQVGPGSAPPGG